MEISIRKPGKGKSYSPDLVPVPTVHHAEIPLSEMFLSIQGEGRWAGIPALFIRTQFCNLGCKWCDSRFTWDKSSFEESSPVEIEKIRDRAVSMVREKAPEGYFPHIVLTGGEPMLHQTALTDLIKLLRETGFSFFEVETNGTVIPEIGFLKEISWFNCSPKLANNGLDDQMRVNHRAIRAIAESGKVDFKFVVRDRADVEEIGHTFGELIPRDSIWLMPEGITREDQLRAMPKITDLCIQYGYRLSPRIHTLVWDNERGR